MARAPRRESEPTSWPVEAIESASIQVAEGQPEVMIRRGSLWPSSHPVVAKYPEFFTDLGMGQIVAPPFPPRK